MSRKLARLIAPTALIAALPVALVAQPSDAAVTQTARLSISDSLTTVGDYVKLTATFTPARRFRPVYLQQLQGTTWVTIVRSSQNSSGRTVFTAPTIYGSRQYRAVTLAQGDLPTRKTDVEKLRVKRPGTIRTSRGSAGSPALGNDMSADGRFVVFTVGDLDEGDIGPQAALWDRASGATTGIPQGNFEGQVRISGDGSTTVAHNVGPFNSPTESTVTAWDRASAKATPAPGVHLAPLPSAITDWVADYDATVSDNGRLVAFRRLTITNKRVVREAIVVWDRTSNDVREVVGKDVDLPVDKVAPVTLSARISGDGAWVAINSLGTPGTPARLWHATDGAITTLPAGADYVADMSADASFLAVGTGYNATPLLLERATNTLKPIKLSGSYTAWSTLAITSLSTTGKWLTVTGLRDGKASVFIVGKLTGRTIRASLTWKGAAANKSAGYGVASDDGQFVIFRTRASNITPVPEFSKDLSYDVFQRDRG